MDDRLQERRANIDNLQRVRSLLTKLQAVFDLPLKMGAALDIGAVEVAVQQYTTVRPVLMRFSHHAAFRKVAADADDLKRQAAEQLKERIRSAPEDAAACLQLMQQLGEPLDHLQVGIVVNTTWSTQNTTRSTQNITRSTQNTAWSTRQL